MDTAFNLENITINKNHGEQEPLVIPSQQVILCHVSPNMPHNFE